MAEVLEGGNAARENMINVGDTLIATTGYTRTTEQTYGEIVVRGGILVYMEDNLYMHIDVLRISSILSCAKLKKGG